MCGSWKCTPDVRAFYTKKVNGMRGNVVYVCGVQVFIRYDDYACTTQGYRLIERERGDLAGVCSACIFKYCTALTHTGSKKCTAVYVMGLSFSFSHIFLSFFLLSFFLFIPHSLSVSHFQIVYKGWKVQTRYGLLIKRNDQCQRVWFGWLDFWPKLIYHRCH